MGKETPKTVKQYRKWNYTHNAIKYGKYAVALIPETAMTIVRWDDWVQACGGNAWSLGLGFTTVIIGILTTMFAIAKKDKLFEKNMSALFGMAIILAIWGIALGFLAKVASEFGYMLLCCAGGMLSAGAIDEVDTLVVEPTALEYKELYDKGFNQRLIKKQERKAERERLANEELQAQKRRAVE